MKRKKLEPENEKFGTELRRRREAKGVSLRALANVLGVQPSYLSQVELGRVAMTEEMTVIAAKVFEMDPAVLYSFSGRVTSELSAIIARHPRAFADLIRQLKSAPEHAILRVIREVRDGEW